MINQELFQSFKTFFKREKGCSNVETEVPVDGGQVDVVAGKLLPRRPEYLFDVEVHIVEVKGEEGDLKKALGQTLWYLYEIEESEGGYPRGLWIDRLYAWIAVPEPLYEKSLAERLKRYGIGSLTISEKNIVTEAEPSIDQGKLPIDTFTRFGSWDAEVKYEDGSKEEISDIDMKNIVEEVKDKSIEKLSPHISKAPGGGGQKQRKWDRLENHPFTKKLFRNWEEAQKSLEKES